MSGMNNPSYTVSLPNIQRLFFVFAAIIWITAASQTRAANPYNPFIITVTDADTGKRIPLVELTTVNKVVFYTDCNGQLALNEPGLMNVGDVYFRINPPAGYEPLSADFFGNRGKAFQPVPGGSAEFSLTADPDPQDSPELSKQQRFRLNHPYNTKAGTFRPFMITVCDAATGRGIPLVRLRTVDDLCYYTDSAGRIAFYEPDLMDQKVAFSIQSYGYSLPSGENVTLKAVSDGVAKIKLERINIAERLYRITGEGIYRDSILLEKPVPLKNPLLCGKVVGQDTVAMTEYKGKLFWLWGDTERPAYPLGNFKTSSATSLPPGRGGLDPGRGVDLNYFVDKDGFSRQMFPRSDAGLVWMGTLVSVNDKGTERLVASYSAMDGKGVSFERGMAIFNDSAETFETLIVYQPGHHIQPAGQAFKKDGYVYVNGPYSVIRIKADLKALSDPASYEAFTCLVSGTGYEGADSKLDRDKNNRLVWDWKQNTSPLDDSQWETLVKAGCVNQAEAWNWLKDTQTGRHVKIAHGSSVYNAYEECWIMVLNQQFGTSFLGEIWIAAAPAPQGPWTKAQKIITHTSKDDTYTFYNVACHPEFDRQNGRSIYFEGTYVTTYSGNPNPTPRYDYNQIMYRLDLTDQNLTGIWP